MLRHGNDAAVGLYGGIDAAPVLAHGRNHFLTLPLPPFGAVFFKSSGKGVDEGGST